MWDHNKDLGGEPAFLDNPLLDIDGVFHAMSKQQGKERLQNSHFEFDKRAMQELDKKSFCSLVIGTPSDVLDQVETPGTLLYEMNRELREIQELVTEETGDNGTLNWESAHMTVRSCADKGEPSDQELVRFAQLSKPIVEKALAVFPDTVLYATGFLFIAAKNKGLSVCTQFFSSTPLIQLIRGSVCSEWETHRNELPSLRPISAFHTRLQHWSILRFRDIENWDRERLPNTLYEKIKSQNGQVYGTISDLQLDDFELRVGRSDALRPTRSIRLGKPDTIERFELCN